MLFFQLLFARGVKNKFVHSCLLVLLFSSAITACSNRIQSFTGPPSVTINVTSSDGASQFSPGISHVDTTLDYPWKNNSLKAVDNVKSLIKNAIPYEDTPIMAWGVSDPWPDSSQPEPSNWGSLDSRLQLILDTRGIPVITLAEAPWWMMGQLQSNGTTQLLTAADEWSDIAYSSRILDNEMGAWLHLVQRVAERYMVGPYNVRYFQVWNELKGYYDPVTNMYDYTTSPGNPNGPNAHHGYTYMYNQVYNRLMQVATSLGIPTDSVKIGGPYVVIDTWSSHQQSNPSTITRGYGTYDQRPLDVVQYWLQHKAGAGFITLDGSNRNKDNVNITDPFTASEKFADVIHWLRSLSPKHYPDAATLPVWWAEWYAVPYTNIANNDYNNAVKSYAIMQLVKAGGTLAFSWGGTSSEDGSTGLWTTTESGGGQPLPWYYSYKAFKDDFAPGTQLYKTQITPSGSVDALASATKIMLVNKTAKNIIVSVNGAIVSLSPYQVHVISYSLP